MRCDSNMKKLKSPKYSIIILLRRFFVVLTLFSMCLGLNQYLQYETITNKVASRERMIENTIMTANGGLVPRRPFNYSTTKVLSSSFELQHSVLTRFMIGQAGQKRLARARLELFKTFCLPTMIHQSTQDFFWIVLMDPGLDQQVIDEMTSLLSTHNFPSSNAYLVLTDNTSWAADGIIPKSNTSATSYGVGLHTVARAFRESIVQVRTGDTSMLLQTLSTNHHPSTSRTQTSTSSTSHLLRHSDPSALILVETLLDADDGLHRGAIETIQRTIVQRVSSSVFLPPLTLKSTWAILCGSAHLEWHNLDIFKMVPQDFAKQGISDGIVGRRETPHECISAGYTRFGVTQNYGRDDKFPRAALLNHYHATKNLNTCQKSNITHCYLRIFHDYDFAIRCRSITSDSMTHVDPDMEFDGRKIGHVKHTKFHLEKEDVSWKTLQDSFFIDRNQVHNVSMLLFMERAAVLSENESGRCIPGFPCLQHTKEKLLKLKAMHVAQATSNTITTATSIQSKKPHKMSSNKLNETKTSVLTIGRGTKKEPKPVVLLDQPKTTPLHSTNTSWVEKRHTCIYSIRERQMNLVGDLIRRNLPRTGSPHKAILAYPAYHSNVGDHMITLGEIEFLRRLNVSIPQEFHQCGDKWPYVVPDCDQQDWWKQKDDFQAHGMPVLLHGGGNWGDLWRHNQVRRIVALDIFLKMNFTIVSMPQSLYYQNQDLMTSDAQDIERTLLTRRKESLPVTFLWRERYSYQKARELYPSANNILMPDIAFQLGPFEPIRLPLNDPKHVDIVIFMREDKESVLAESRNTTIIENMLTPLMQKKKQNLNKLPSFTIVDWNDRLKLFESKNVLFTDTAIRMLSMGRIFICDRLHASILAYLSGIPFIYIDQVSGKINKTLEVALDSAEGCLDGNAAHFAQAMNLTEALKMALDYLEKERF